MAIDVSDRLKSSIKVVTCYARKVNELLEQEHPDDVLMCQVPDSDIESGDYVEHWKNHYEQTSHRNELVYPVREVAIS